MINNIDSIRRGGGFKFPTFFKVWAVGLWLVTSMYLWIYSERWLDGLGSPFVFVLALPPILAITLATGAVFRARRRLWLRIFAAMVMPLLYAVLWIALGAVMARVVVAGLAGGMIDYLSNMYIFINSEIGELSLIFVMSYALLLLTSLLSRRELKS